MLKKKSWIFPFIHTHIKSACGQNKAHPPSKFHSLVF